MKRKVTKEMWDGNRLITVILKQSWCKKIYQAKISFEAKYSISNSKTEGKLIQCHLSKFEFCTFFLVSSIIGFFLWIFPWWFFFVTNIIENRRDVLHKMLNCIYLQIHSWILNAFKAVDKHDNIFNWMRPLLD